MKIQDIAYIIILISLFILFRKNPKVFVWFGLVSLALSIPLFTFWVFFTAQRLVCYGAGFILIATILIASKIYREKK